LTDAPVSGIDLPSRMTESASTEVG